MEKREYKAHRNQKYSSNISKTAHRLRVFFKFGRRWSRNPQKHLSFTWLSEVFAKSGSYETTLDVACGNLNNFPFIKSPKYIGVDMNSSSLEYGKVLYEDAETKLLHIEELDEAEVYGDLVICTQTIGINTYFDSSMTIPNVKSLVNCTKKNGALAFDIGPLSISKSDEIEKRLQDNFEKVDVREFGAHDGSRFMPISVFLAFLMNNFPSLRTDGEVKRKFYFCEGRK